ncbi:MAG: MBL fold metallo-hydrolase [Nitrososphaerales archaeon]
MKSDTSISFYGGVHEIGGNKFLLEDKGTRTFLDFGMQMGKANQYFAEYLQPRDLNGMGDLIEFGLLPPLRGLYRQDFSRHSNYGDHEEETAFDAVLLTHAHLDHAAYIHYLRPDIPIYCTEATKLVMQALEDTGSEEQYITYKEKFKVYRNRNGDLSRAEDEKNRLEVVRPINVIESSKKFQLDSIEVEPIEIDHSIPGVSGFILHTSRGSIAYTADIRFHGRRREDSERFLDRCSNSELDVLLCEGTRIHETNSKTELDVESDVKAIIDATTQLVVCTYPPRDLDRLLSFYKAATEAGRDLVIDLKQAYLLRLFQRSERYRGLYPGVDDKGIRVYLPRKSWGLVDRDINLWSKKQRDGDYKVWEREFLDLPNVVDWREVSEKQSDYVFFCSDYSLQNLIDVRPKAGSSYIRSSTEPFDDEMKFDEARVRRWVEHFGLISKESEWNHVHVSGHGDGQQLKRVIENSNAKCLIPIHTEHEEYHKKWHRNVRTVQLNECVEL